MRVCREVTLLKREGEKGRDVREEGEKGGEGKLRRWAGGVSKSITCGSVVGQVK